MDNFNPVPDSRLVYREVSFSIPANSTLPVAIQFQMLKVISCSDDTALQGAIGYSTDTIRLAVGLGYGVTAREVDEGKFYNGLTIRNITGATVTISIAFAFGNITDDRVSIGGSVVVSGTVNTNNVAGTTILNGQVSVTTTATAIRFTQAARRYIIIKNHSTSGAAVFIGTTSVTTANGIELAIGESITIDTQDEIYARTAAGTATIGWLEARN